MYNTESLILQPGDTAFLYTDGVTEAMNKDEILYSGKGKPINLIE